MKTSRRGRIVVALALVLIAAAIFFVAKGQYLEQLALASGFKAQTLCAGIFISGRDETAVASEDAGFNPLFRLIKARVNRETQSVTCSLLGTGLFSKTAVHVPDLGAVLLSGRSVAEVLAMRPALLPPESENAALPWPRGEGPTSGPRPQGVDDPALKTALDRLFSEPNPRQLKRTRALLVVLDGRIVAERYAPGFDARTRLISWSMAKSFTNALVGILSLEGMLDIRKPAPVKEWSKAADQRGRITTDELLRMSSGLVFHESYDKDPISDVNRMLFLESDFAAYAARKPLAAPPDTVWNYSSGSSNIVSRIVRNAIGEDRRYWAFPRSALFGRIGMKSAEWGVDAAGDFVGSSNLYATARDYARFGLLCLKDGVWNGERILPRGWMAYSTTPTPTDSERHYGAFFWLNVGPRGRSQARTFPSMPPDAYWCDGYQGQMILVCPSLRLVVVRLGMTWEGGDWGADAFLSDLRKAIGR